MGTGCDILYSPKLSNPVFLMCSLCVPYVYLMWAIYSLPIAAHVECSIRLNEYQGTRVPGFNEYRLRAIILSPLGAHLQCSLGLSYIYIYRYIHITENVYRLRAIILSPPCGAS
jgi:hypothetical protein